MVSSQQHGGAVERVAAVNEGHECAWTEGKGTEQHNRLAATRMNYLNINIPVCQALMLGCFT